MRELRDMEKRLALTEALETARRGDRLRECKTLGGLLEAATLFLPPGEVPAILRTSAHQPGARYILAVVPPGPHLVPGEWHAGPVTADGRDGIALVLVVDAGLARALEARPVWPAGR